MKEIEPSFVLDGKDICMVMGYTPENPKFAAVGEISQEANVSYCRSKGYAARIYTSGFDEKRHPSWSKILLVRDALRHYPWVFWIDVDAIVTNPSIGLEQFIDEEMMLVVGRQNWNMSVWNSVNFGVFLIHAVPEVDEFLDNVWLDIDREGRIGWEQDGVRWWMCEEKFKSKVKMVWRRSFNSLVPHESLMLDNTFDYETEAWKKGDFVAHFGGRRDDLDVAMKTILGNL